MSAPTLPQKSGDHQELLREVKYRLSYRGTLELDTLCRRLLARLDAVPREQIAPLRDFLLEGENDLMAWLVDNRPAPAAYASLIGLFKTK